MRQLTCLIVITLSCGCLPSKSKDGGGTTRDCGTDYIEATNKDDNTYTLANLNKPTYGVEVSYGNTRPSGLSWKIEGTDIVVGSDEKYALDYSESANSWNLFDASGAMAGNLAPFKTTSCARVQRLSLSLFIRQEEADAFLSYTTE